ncbi:MAG: helix-turn-helix transcriptional regulator [Clostridia bacterium]|nr:helix-turn-helix transcriptional regulator [Clostridia bacterium]
MSVLSETIISLRKAANETQNDLADALGISNRTVSKWENGESEPDCRYLTELARHYHTTVDNLLGYEAEPKSDKPATNEEGANACFREIFEATRRLTAVFSANFKSVYRPDDDGTPQIPDRIPELQGCRDTGVTSSRIISRVVCTDDNNIAYTLMTNKANYRWMHDDAEKLADFFRALSDPRLIKLAHMMYNPAFPDAFTPEFAAEKCGCTAEEVIPLLERMSWTKSTVELEEGEALIYRLQPDHVMLVILALAHEATIEDYSSCGSFNGTVAPILDEEVQA